MNNAAPAPWPAKHAARTLLGYMLDTRLAGNDPRADVTVSSPWDTWWAGYRARLPLTKLAPRLGANGRPCCHCARQVARLAATDPPGHPGTGPQPCRCLLRWAETMRAPEPAVTWPGIRLSLALIKPAAPAAIIIALLATEYAILHTYKLTLATADTQRLYPEAYGAGYVRDRDAYLTSGQSQALILLTRQPGADPGAIKQHIRAQLGAGPLRNHLHMPDNPGEALADIAHFAGYPMLAQLYRRYERGHYTARRLAFYRTALGISPAGTDRLPAAG